MQYIVYRCTNLTGHTVEAYAQDIHKLTVHHSF